MLAAKVLQMLSTAGAGLLVSSSSRCTLLEEGVSERIRSDQLNQLNQLIQMLNGPYQEQPSEDRDWRGLATTLDVLTEALAPHRVRPPEPGNSRRNICTVEDGCLEDVLAQICSFKLSNLQKTEQKMGCGASSKVSQPAGFVDITGDHMTRKRRTRRSAICVLPSNVVDGSDSVDLDAIDDLIDPKGSWNSNVARPPVGLRVPLPPNRKMHERHMKKMNRFLEQMDSETLNVAVDFKRELHDLRLKLEPEAIINS
eukprot:s4353_g1.t1